MAEANTTPTEAAGEVEDIGFDELGLERDHFAVADEEDAATPAVPAEKETPAGTEEATDDVETPAKEEPKEEVPVVAPVNEELKAIFPDVKDEKELVAAVTEMNAKLGTATKERDDEKAANGEMIALLNAHPALIDLLRQVRDGVPLHDAVRKSLEIGAEETIPDPVEDRKAYADYVERQLALKARLKAEEQARTDGAAKAEAARTKALDMKAKFQTAKKLTDADMEKRLAHYRRLMFGDPVTGELPDNFLELMERTFAYDKDIEAAVKKAEVDTRNTTIDKILHKKDVKGDGMPPLRSGITRQTKTVDELSDLEASLAPRKDIYDL